MPQGAAASPVPAHIGHPGTEEKARKIVPISYFFRSVLSLGVS